MDRTERFYKIDRLLHSHEFVTMQQFIEELAASKATVTRDLEYMRDRLNAPISWNRQQRGYCYDKSDDTQQSRYALPGLWLNAEEFHALLTMEHLIVHLQPGLLKSQLQPLKERIRQLLDSGDHSAAEVEHRIQLIHSATRTVSSNYFQLISSALLQRQRLIINHFNRTKQTSSERQISPQRLLFYRDNWYLLAWCHVRNGLRNFSLDAVTSAALLTEPALECNAEELDQQVGSSYGIFSGTPNQLATLRFTPQSARWVAAECWHPQQQGKFDTEGYYLLTIPYSHDQEIIMDILRHGADVQVLQPLSLRDKIARRLQQAWAQYQTTE